MRVLLSILLLIHGFIHLFGFLKAFGYAKFEAISQPVSRPIGILWLAAFAVFLLSVVAYLANKQYWIYSAFVAICVSQVLIILYWSDAKFGTLANFIILVIALIAYADFSFSQMVAQDKARLKSNVKTESKSIMVEEDLESLPFPVRRWLKGSGALENPRVNTVSLSQTVEMKLKPDQTDWIPAKADQYFTINPPAFVWSVSMKMNSVIPVRGRDKFEDGKGAMLIKLFSVLPVVDEKDQANINQASLQRYLAEIVWFPSAALSPSISWEEIDASSAKATMTYNGTEGSGIFYFDENGHFKEFITMRYKDMDSNEKTQWIVRATKTETMNGVVVPVEAEAEWRQEDGSFWKWLKLRVEEISYD